MAHRYISDLTRADVTPKEMWRTRRQIMTGAGAAALGLAAGPALAKLGAVKTDYGQDLEPNRWDDITSYNNFYEFGTGKEDPARNSGDMVTDFWTVKVDGLVDAPGEYTMAQLLDGMTIEERVYRFRCVEAWSMVVPWAGFELADLLNKVGVKPEAKYVSFETAVIPDVMEGVSYPVLDWP